jgi:excisionase family DNA binding protein
MTVALTPPNEQSPPPDPSALLVSETDAAALLGVSKATFRDLVKGGHLTRVTLPSGARRNLYRRHDLEAFADGLADGAPDGR